MPQLKQSNRRKGHKNSNYIPPKKITTDFILQRLMLANEDFFSQHQWASEHDRWTELIFSLLTRISPHDQHELRRIVMELKSLGLLNVEILADSSQQKDEMNKVCITDVLIENGFTKKEIEAFLITISEAAAVIQMKYAGKIQQYLRSYGELILSEVKENFKFSKLSQDDAKYAFTLWLQNTMNMPLSLLSNDVKSFCKSQNIDTTSLVEAADKMDLNLALMDDLITEYIAETESAKNDKQ